MFGEKHITWALMLTGFIVGIPLFYNVGFVLLVPLIFSVAYYSKLPAVYLGVPLLASLSVTHGFLPPHPAPTAMVPMFNASMSTTLIYGMFVAVPAMVIAGPVFARFFRNAQSKLPELFVPQDMPADQLPGTFNCFATALLPVVMIAGSAALPGLATEGTQLYAFLKFISDPFVVMLVALLVATGTLVPGARHADRAANGALQRRGQGYRRDLADHCGRRCAQADFRRHGCQRRDLRGTARSRNQSAATRVDHRDGHSSVPRLRDRRRSNRSGHHGARSSHRRGSIRTSWCSPSAQAASCSLTSTTLVSGCSRSTST